MFYRLTLFALLVLVLSGCTGNDWRTTDVSDVMPPLNFKLTDEQGKTVTEKDYVGKATLLFFGYTHCPDVCPTTLARLTSIIRQLDPALRDKIQILFVSVDPARDTPKMLASYTSAFGPEVVGLTGDKAELADITNRFRITYSYGEPDQDGNYTVTHSGAVFAFDRQGDPTFMVIQSDPTSDVKADITHLIEAGMNG